MRPPVDLRSGDRRNLLNPQSHLPVIRITYDRPALIHRVWRVETLAGAADSEGGSMLKTPVKKYKKYKGNSAGPNATFEAALQNALVAAAQAEKTNHFFWKLATVHGDFGGFAAKNITAEIRIGNRARV